MPYPSLSLSIICLLSLCTHSHHPRYSLTSQVARETEALIRARRDEHEALRRHRETLMKAAEEVNQLVDSAYAFTSSHRAFTSTYIRLLYDYPLTDESTNSLPLPTY
jgi:hypothetical protein